MLGKILVQKERAMDKTHTVKGWEPISYCSALPLTALIDYLTEERPGTAPHQPSCLEVQGSDTVAQLLCQMMQGTPSNGYFSPLVEEDIKVQARWALDLVLSQPRRYQQGVWQHPTLTGAQRTFFLSRPFQSRREGDKFGLTCDTKVTWLQKQPSLAEWGLEAKIPGSCISSIAKVLAPGWAQALSFCQSTKVRDRPSYFSPPFISSLAILQILIKTVLFARGWYVLPTAHCGRFQIALLDQPLCIYLPATQ